MKISDLKKGDWFTINLQKKVKNSYKYVGRFDNNLCECTLVNDEILFNNNTKVTLIKGFQLYLLQGGRDWD